MSKRASSRSADRSGQAPPAAPSTPTEKGTSDGAEGLPAQQVASPLGQSMPAEPMITSQPDVDGAAERDNAWIWWGPPSNSDHDVGKSESAHSDESDATTSSTKWVWQRRIDKENASQNALQLQQQQLEEEEERLAAEEEQQRIEQQELLQARALNNGGGGGGGHGDDDDDDDEDIDPMDYM
mmetsp:Transcript_12254/g.26901  ORF Transcript_12254/g.26901 Transcript_12254/m.26901 type:complete len:182 (-) Transcript_12254:117-662(-)